jgi:hypothetical protein
MAMTEEQKQSRPCGNDHALPCGVDINCEVGIEFFKATLTDEQVYQKYKESFE